jgi:hypothetical protein
MQRHPMNGLLAASIVAPLALAFAAPAAADEITRLDPDKGTVVVDKVAEIADENWVEVSYRLDPKGPVKKTPTRFVLDVRRASEDAQAAQLQGGLDDLAQGRFKDATTAFSNVGGGGPVVDESGKLVFRAFGAGEAGKPKWYAEYAHYWYAYAAWRLATTGPEKDRQATLEFALRAIEADKPAGKEGGKDVPAEKGFLARYKEGKSRFYPHALLLRADLLADLGRADQAIAAYDALYQKSLTTPIGARWSFEAKVGPGRVAEIKGVGTEAETAYEAAAAAMDSLLVEAKDRPSRDALGRYYNETRMRKAAIMLRTAESEKSPAAYGRLRDYLNGGTPEALERKFSGKPPEVVAAVKAGAMSPTVQAVAQNGIGLAYLAEKKWTEALFAFGSVRIKYFQVAAEVPRALYYLAQAADGAAEAASKPEAKTMYKAQAEAARAEIKTSYKDWTPGK